MEYDIAPQKSQILSGHTGLNVKYHTAKRIAPSKIRTSAKPKAIPGVANGKGWAQFNGR